MKKLLYLIGLLGSMSLTIGITLKILHLSYANILFIIGLLSLSMLFIPLFAIEKYKGRQNKTTAFKFKVYLGSTASLVIGLSGIFKVMHLQGANVLLGLGTIIFTFGFLPFFFYSMYKKSNS